MTYETVFDVARNGYAAWWFPALGLVGVVFAAVLVLKRGRVMDRVGLALTMLWTTGAFVVTYVTYRDASLRLQEGRCKVVEGPVTGFTELPKGGWSQKAESFVVDGQRFKYYGAVVTPGFHQMASQGGPVREGLNVRITYSGSDILRLEIAR